MPEDHRRGGEHDSGDERDLDVRDVYELADDLRVVRRYDLALS